MFEDYNLVDILIGLFLVYISLRIFIFARNPDLLVLKERLASLEAVECVLEEMNGQFYLWMIIPDEGYKFIGQSTNKQTLADLGSKYLRRKYGVDDD
jgi:hypothetical protein